MKLIPLLSALFISFTISNANALPRITAQNKNIDFSALQLNFTDGYDFEGIIALSNCSGSLVRFSQSKEDDKALVLTNGHCTGGIFGGMMNPGEFYFNKKDTRSMDVLNAKDGSSIGKIKAEKILYATMTGTDMALFQMRETYRDISTKFKTRPFTLSEKQTNIGTEMEIISGYWKKGYSCKVDAFVSHLREAGYDFKNSIRYSETGCETIPGTSGSPIIEKGTREIIGVNNTGNEKGEMCTMDNPCEVDENGKTVALKGRSYGQQTFWVYSCFNLKGEFDLSVAGCLLNH